MSFWNYVMRLEKAILNHAQREDKCSWCGNSKADGHKDTCIVDEITRFSKDFGTIATDPNNRNSPVIKASQDKEHCFLCGSLIDRYSLPDDRMVRCNNSKCKYSSGYPDVIFEQDKELNEQSGRNPY